VPYPLAADDHQTKNARVIEDNGAGKLIPDGQLTGDLLINSVNECIQNKNKLTEMRKKAKALSFPNAADMIVDEIEKLLL